MGKRHSASGITAARRLTKKDRQAIGAANAPAVVPAPKNGGLGSCFKGRPLPADWTTPMTPAEHAARNRRGKAEEHPVTAVTVTVTDKVTPEPWYQGWIEFNKAYAARPTISSYLACKHDQDLSRWRWVGVD